MQDVSSGPPLADPRHDLLEALAVLPPDPAAVLSAFERMPIRTRSKLPQSTYDSLFKACARTDVMLDEPQDNPLQYVGTGSAAAAVPDPRTLVDYTVVESQLLLLEQLYHALPRHFSDSEHAATLDASLHASAIRLGKLGTASDASEAEYAAKVFAHKDILRARLRQVTALRTSEYRSSRQLASAVPWATLGLYSRFLALHTPLGGKAGLARRMFYASLRGRQAWLKHAQAPHRSTRFSNEARALSDHLLIDTAHILIRHRRFDQRGRLDGLKVATALIDLGDLNPSSAVMMAYLKRLYSSSDRHLWTEASTYWTGTQATTASGKWLAIRAEMVAMPEAGSARGLDAAYSLFNALRSEASQSSAMPHQTPTTDGTMCNLLMSKLLLLESRPALTSSETVPARNLTLAIAIRTFTLSQGSVVSNPITERLLDIIISRSRTPSGKPRRAWLRRVVAMLFWERMGAQRSSAGSAAASPKALELVRGLVRYRQDHDHAVSILLNMAEFGLVAPLTSLGTSVLAQLVQSTVAIDPDVAIELYHHAQTLDPEASFSLLSTMCATAAERGDCAWAGLMMDRLGGQGTARRRLAATGIVTIFANRSTLPKAIEVYDAVGARWPTFLHAGLLSPIVYRLLSARDQAAPERARVVELLLARLLALQERSDGRLARDALLDVLCNVSASTGQIHQGFVDLLACSLREAREPSRAVVNAGLLGLAAEDTATAASMFERLIAAGIPVQGPTVARLMEAMIASDQLLQAAEVNRRWRGMIWRFRRAERGDDGAVIQAMGRLEEKILQQARLADAATEHCDVAQGAREVVNRGDLAGNGPGRTMSVRADASSFVLC